MKPIHILLIVLVILGLIGTCAGIGVVGWYAIGPSGFRRIEVGPISGSSIMAETTEEATFEVDGQATLTLNNVFGDVDVTAVEGSQVRIIAQKKAWANTDAAAENYLELLKVNMTQEGNFIRVTVEYPNTSGINQERTASVGFTIEVPVTTTLDITVNSGDISVQGTQGKTALNTNFGNVEVTDLQGGLVARSRSGKVTARNIGLWDLPEGKFGDVDLSSDFGDVTLDGAITQKVSLSSRSGKIRLNNVSSDGAVVISDDFGEIEFSSGKAESLEAQTRSGAVRLTDLAVRNEVTAHSDFGEVNLEQVDGGSYDVSANSGKITIEGARGDVLAHTQTGDIEISGGKQATLDLEVRTGSISYQGSLGEGPHRLRSEFGDITVSLPQDSAFDFDLETGFGTIDSEFDVLISGEPDDKHWIGQVNGGGSELAVSSGSGDVSLEIVDQPKE